MLFRKRPKREIQLAEAKVPEGVESVLHIAVLARRRSEDEETRALMKKVAALVREETAFNGAFAFVSEAVVDYDSPSQPDARIEIVAREL